MTPTTTISNSFRKHGTFIYGASDTINDYGSTSLLVAAMQRAGMTNAWVRIHGTNRYPSAERKIIQALVGEMQNSGINVAGWGWCQGASVQSDIRLAVNESKFFGLTDYLADIENGVNNSNWSATEIQTFCTAVRSGIGGSFGITTFPLIDWHEPELMQAALSSVDLFAPQVYWFNFPNAKMTKEFQRPDGTTYSTNDPAQYADLCLDRWEQLIGASAKGLVLTGQAYWGESGFTQQTAELKLEGFLGDWSGFNRIVGLNWWHFGGGQAMSHRMLEAITGAQLSQKSYKI
jgi:hypothetical protein